MIDFMKTFNRKFDNTYFSELFMKGLKQTLSKPEPRKLGKNSSAMPSKKSKKSVWEDLHSLI